MRQDSEASRWSFDNAKEPGIARKRRGDVAFWNGIAFRETNISSDLEEYRI
jgi:hypothetical protein